MMLVCQVAQHKHRVHRHRHHHHRRRRHHHHRRHQQHHHHHHHLRHRHHHLGGMLLNEPTAIVFTDNINHPSRVGICSAPAF